MEEGIRLSVLGCFLFRNEDFNQLISRLNLSILKALFQKKNVKVLSQEFFENLIKEIQTLEKSSNEMELEKENNSTLSNMQETTKEKSTNRLAQIIQLQFTFSDQKEMLLHILDLLPPTSLVKLIIKKNKKE